MTSSPPPAYEEVVAHRVDQHYLTCTRGGNEEDLKSHTKHRVGTFAVRGWIASHGGTIVAVGPWWMDLQKGKIWEVAKPAPDQSTKPTQDRSTKEKVIQALRSLDCLRTKQEVATIFAVNGTPIQPGEFEYTILSPTDTTGSGDYDWTMKWGWKVKLRAYTYAKHVGCSRWTITSRMFLDDLPSLLRAGGISWKDVMVDIDDDRFDEDSFPKRRWNWVRSYFCWPSSASGQKWKADVDERRQEQSLERDFRHRLSPETVYR